jgi:hypothetical protein
MNNYSKVVITLTTVPDRLECENIRGIPSVIHALCKQDYDNYEIHFNIPHIHKVKNKEYIIPEWLDTLQQKYKHLKVFRTEDYGPPTKIVPTILRLNEPETIIIVVDDDFVYNKQLINEHVNYQKNFTKTAIGYDGLGSIIPEYGDGRDHFVCLVDKPTEVSTLQHYRSVSYKREFFEQDFFDVFVGKTLSDDILVSLYMRYKDIPLIVVPIPNHIPCINKEEYQNRIAVLQFPLDDRGYAPLDTGACDPEILKIQPRFFIPPELEDLIRYKNSKIDAKIMEDMVLFKLGNLYETDKSSPHNYTNYYDNYFKKIKDDIKNVCEIGIYNGGSLKMWRDYFINAKIYGIDIVPSPLDKTEERIITAVVDQSKRQELELFVDMHGLDNLDVIIDDGSHIMKDQQISFGVLFNSLKSGGVYILEDLHTSMNIHEDRYGYQSSLISTYDMLNKFKETGLIESEWMTDSEKEYLNNNIESIEIIVPVGTTVNDSCTSLIIKK